MHLKGSPRKKCFAEEHQNILIFDTFPNGIQKCFIQLLLIASVLDSISTVELSFYFYGSTQNSSKPSNVKTSVLMQSQALQFFLFCLREVDYTLKNAFRDTIIKGSKRNYWKNICHGFLLTRDFPLF
jgi:hypothetical protein